MLSACLTNFCAKNERWKEKFDRYLGLKEFSGLERERILETLCELLMNPQYTEDVARHFPRLLPALVSIAIPTDELSKSVVIDRNIAHRLYSTVLGKLVNKHQDLLVFVLRYFDVNPAPFETIESNSIAPTKRRNTRRIFFSPIEVTDYDIVVASYNILRAAINHFKHKWNWSKFFKYLLSNDDKTKWVALNCIGMVLGMSESLRLCSAHSFIQKLDDFLIHYSDHPKDLQDIYIKNVNLMDDEITNDISIDIVSVGGILLPTFGGNENQFDETADKRSLVTVPSMEENLRKLAVALASRRCICLQGAVGSGKTALIEYLARYTGHGSLDLIKVQLGDQTDSKMLLGTYRCTDIPGEFVWQPGVLTEAVVKGKWLLLEDIDCATLDVASVLCNLIETGTLSVPGYRDSLQAKSGFQLFVTQRLLSSITGPQRQHSGASNLLDKHWLRIHLELLTRDELVTVIQTSFPILSTVANKMVDVFFLFSTGNHGSDDVDALILSKFGRQISTRDLMKWCSRATVDFNVSSPESLLNIFQDAVDVFCCSVADRVQRLKLAIAVAHKLGIVKTKAEYYFDVHKPSPTLLPDTLIVGRARLGRKRSEYAILEKTRSNFSFTRPSACLIERVASCIARGEPVLLVGETGTGKTTSVQYLAETTGHKMVVINMNQQSESADLLGGYKPVDLKFLISPIREEFEMLFRSYFAVEPNRKFLDHIALCYKESKWKTLVNLMNHSALAAVKRLKDEDHLVPEQTLHSKRRNHNENQGESRKNAQARQTLEKWEKMTQKLSKLMQQLKTQYSVAFSFVEGSLIKALRNGHWVLLDEINLATAETLDCLYGLLEDSCGSLSLLERGDKESVKRHKDFAVFACMNPATDVGKRDLPIGLRNRFTEFYIDELVDRSDLQLLVSSYLKDLNLTADKHDAIVKFYLNVRKEAAKTLLDGTAHKPHYSLRTLCRALCMSASNPCGNVTRSLYEAFSLSFLTQLDRNSYPIVERMIGRAILDNKSVKAILGTPIPKPRCAIGEEYISFEGYWVVRGTLQPEISENYILTPSVRQNLKDLVRVVSIAKMPVLLQGDTSVGKTSLITYLAKASGHVCVRINNHEHTDLQEYVGSYVSDANGKLVFKEGVLVEAMHKGHWIILDELNLAPSDVLEALNRVLDDNRELFIPETQQVVKAHDNFMLFATQNPPGLYGGRKVLSRAFRNRFVELHFDEIPPNELQTILHERCKMPISYCKQVINVMTDLQIRRKSTAAFAGKKGFITLRDLFRWGERYRLAPDVGKQLYDWSQHLADEGYLVLAAKVRKPEEAEEIRGAIKKHLKRDVDPENLFTLSDKTSPVTKSILEDVLKNNLPGFEHIVWTYQMRRLAVLVKKSFNFKEPVLLVGETGGGKTTICQLIASMLKQLVYSVNCHMHTESSDFLGNLRPVRERDNVENQRLFEWVDGPLIHAMRNGDLFLADEISLADDSVLERLNSLLEPERSLLLAEKGIDSASEREINDVIVADEKFMFIGTMNPGGDYGKKELSPALRNRFTEVWCDSCVASKDLLEIIEHNLREFSEVSRRSIATAILNFLEWLPRTDVGKKLVVSIRDVLTWVRFVNLCTSFDTVPRLNLGDAYYHGACLTYIDSLGSGTTGSESTKNIAQFRGAALKFIEHEIRNTLRSVLHLENVSLKSVKTAPDTFGIPPFFIKRGSSNSLEQDTFNLSTPTARSNALKVLRALQLSKPILLEGSPGVGKTSLVSALAKASGHTLFRINLSDQTDISDLFGSDLPIEGGKGGEFAWKDGPFLRALRAGHWILLDELNLASQSVLEGLNACFDHRGEVYVPELGKTFTVKPGTRLFGCQNPLTQGGARRGLPKSFLNRFTQVFIDALLDEDFELILKTQYSQLPSDLIRSMIKFNGELASEVGVAWGILGSPWEMNLRDIVRWCEVTVQAAASTQDSIYYNPGEAVELIYVNRMRTEEDRQRVRAIYREIFPMEKYPLPPRQQPVYVTKDSVIIGDVKLERTNSSIYEGNNLLLLRDQTATLRNLMQCVDMNWMSIIVGASGCGKSNVVRLLASLAGQQLKSVVVNSAMDTTEILGGFEQMDYHRHLEDLFERTEALLIDSLKEKLSKDNLEEIAAYHELLENVRRVSEVDESVERSLSAETDLFLRKVDALLDLVSSMKTLEAAYAPTLEEIEANLRGLSASVLQDRCLNAGGKFEWVDSILVKCLRDGTWLLIDQVNLCSPAVLDRLNGLLEPNGVLSIGERGVDSQGNIVTVRPHENFRLFLTMDPRYGEISRAMRNRGVEIYMLSPKENVPHDAIDLKSLLHNAGLQRENHRDVLLEIHGRSSAELRPLDGSLGLVELMHAAFLINEQLVRGFPPRLAIESACTDVYVTWRSIRNSQIRASLVAIIEEAVDKLSDQHTNYFDVDAVTWSTRSLRDNSALTVVRQQGFLLDSTLKILEQTTEGDVARNSRILNEFCGLRENDRGILDVDLRELWLHLLLDFYERSSLEDVPLRSRWVSEIMREGILEELDVKNKALADEILAFEFDSTRRELPWSLPRSSRLCKLKEEESVDNLADRLALILYLRTMIYTETEQRKGLDRAKRAKDITVRQYSSAVRDDRLLSTLKKQPLVTNFTRLVEVTRSCIDAVLHDARMSMKDRSYHRLRNDLKWYARFDRLGETLLISKVERSRRVFANLEEVSSSLRVHYKWLKKFLESFIEASRELPLSVETSSKIESLSTTLRETNVQLLSLHDPFRRISKRLRKHLTLPQPHSTEISMLVDEKLRDLLKKFILQSDENDVDDRSRLRSKILAIQIDEAPSIRQRLVSLCNRVYSTNEIDERVLETVLEIEELSKGCNLELRTPTELSEFAENSRRIGDEEIARLSWRTQLWPIYEYIFLTLGYATQGKLCRGRASDAPLEIFLDVPSIPANILGLLNAIKESMEDEKRRVPLSHELFLRLADFSSRSCATKNREVFARWSGTRETTEAIDRRDQFTGSPVLFDLILELVLNKAEAGKCGNKEIVPTATLGAYGASVNQLECLNSTMWRNSGSLSSEEYNFANNDLLALEFYLDLYLVAIDKTSVERNVQRIASKGGIHEAKEELKDRLVRELLDPIEELRGLRKTLDGTESSPMIRGKAWMLLGYIELLLFGNLGYIDPVLKVGLRLEYLEQSIDDCRKSIYVSSLQSSILGTCLEDERAHPRLLGMEDCLSSMLQEAQDLGHGKAFRPKSSEFLHLSKEAADFRNTLGSYDTVRKHIDALADFAGKIEDRVVFSEKKAQEVLVEAETWARSLQRFSNRMERRFLTTYPDMILPILGALSRLRHGASLLVNQLKTITVTNSLENDAVQSLIYNLIRYPTIGPRQEDLLSLTEACTSEMTRELVLKSTSSLDSFVTLQEQFKLLKCGLYEVRNRVLVDGELDRAVWTTLNYLLQQIVLLWKQQKLEEERREAEKRSLYKNKAEVLGKNLTEDEELALELERLFPTHAELFDSEEELGGALEEKLAERREEEESYRGLITTDDMNEVQEIHSEIVRSFAQSNWLARRTSDASANYVEPLVQRYKAVHSIVENLGLKLHERIATKLHASLNFLVAAALSAIDDKTDRPRLREQTRKRKKFYDFYADSNIEEARQCLPLCETILRRTRELLEEWPEHPTLASIKTIIERIHGFSVASPLSRFLTGLEMLLTKMHQWEENAHSGVSLSEHAQELTRRIISWRRLQLSCWKDCLDTTYEYLKSQTSKWWFFLYALVESFLSREEAGSEEAAMNGEEKKDKVITVGKLVETLERFMNESSLVEFEPRLDLLLTFHCHANNLEPSTPRDELLAVLWNVHGYYDQFRSDVRSRINALRAPIEKKLRDFVKICRWNDINYWAVKESVEKTHRSLHKFRREFEGALKQNASICLNVRAEPCNTEIGKGEWDDQVGHREYLINPTDFTVSEASLLRTKVLLEFAKCEHVLRAEKISSKARGLCKEVILMSSYPCLRTEIESFVEGVMEQSLKLRNAEVDRSMPKSRQKSMAKSILQQKRLLLSNYFKSLTRMGVSHRLGNLTWKNHADEIIDFTAPPLDLSTLKRHLICSGIDAQTLIQWTSCDKYYYKSLIKMNALNATLAAAQNDLGPQNVERCRGYSAHVMLMAHRQKRTLAGLFENFLPLRAQIANVSEIVERGFRQVDLRNSMGDVKDLLRTLQVDFEQLRLYLEGCPAESLVEEHVVVLNRNEFPLLYANQGDGTVARINSLVNESLEMVRNMVKRYNSLAIPENPVFLSFKHLKFVENSYKTMEALISRLEQLKELFGTAEEQHPIVETILFLEEKIKDSLNRFKRMERSLHHKSEGANDHIVERYEQDLNRLIGSILLVIQKKYKENVELNNEPMRENEGAMETEDEKDRAEEFEENCLSHRLVESLKRDITDLKMEKISRDLNELVGGMHEFDLETTIRCTRLLSKCAPLLQQYILLSQYYLNEQVASFRITCKLLYLQLNVFLDLAAHGFCVPKDLEEGDSNERGESKSQGGLGLGEGQGEKDVSDRIESEDQLEDARPMDQEERKKEEEEGCREEEKGIDMSEDFEGKPQDLEKKEEEEEEGEKEEDEELDKEMGETEEGVDRLDEEIWGDDEAEEEDRSKETDEQGKGEETGEKEMSGKDGSRENPADEEERSQEEKEELGKEINEMNEPEVNEDQIDPYHGKNQPPPEPEPLDLPEDINLDGDDEAKEDNAGEDVDPFDVDEMKESNPPQETEETAKEAEDEKKPDRQEDSSDDEEENTENTETNDTKNIEENKDVSEETPEPDKDTLDSNESKKADDKLKDDDKKEEDETTENEKEEDRKEERAAPSVNDSSKEMDQAEEVKPQKDASHDAVAHQPMDDDEDQTKPEKDEKRTENEDKGRSQGGQEQGHADSAPRTNAQVSRHDNTPRQKDKRRNPGESDENRSLVEKLEPKAKKSRMVEDVVSPKDSSDKPEEGGTEDDLEADMCQHVKDTEDFDSYAMDAATDDQVKKQASNLEEEEQPKEDEAMDVDLHEEKEEEEKIEKQEERTAETMDSGAREKTKNEGSQKVDNPENCLLETTAEIPGDVAETLKVQRGSETTFHTNIQEIDAENGGTNLAERKRFEVERILSEWSCKPSSEEAAGVWNSLSTVTEAPARDLSEKLRLVLEPTQASRLRGDYRTGRRINMRKIIPYIASEFRKDKIWLRRTKPSKRDYQIVLALDDSSSMADNHSKELAFESLSLISKAMTYLEVGQLGVISFGEHVNILHPLGETFTEHSGSRLIQEMTFEQKKTMMGQLVDFTVDMFESQTSSSDNAKLLVVLSDGRGIFSEGTDRVNAAVRRAKLADIFLVFIIVDNPINKDSILDIRMPIFEGGKLLSIKSYMDSFPFPFYMILRDINMLPGVLSDALRQWFEVVGKIDT